MHFGMSEVEKMGKSKELFFQKMSMSLYSSRFIYCPVLARALLQHIILKCLMLKFEKIGNTNIRKYISIENMSIYPTSYEDMCNIQGHSDFPVFDF